MHAMWKGSISFGLVNIPIKMFAATERKQLRFRYLHRKCQTPVENVRTCPHCQVEVPWNDVVKGYEYTEGKFVLMEKEELEQTGKDAPKTIEIIDFVELREIDPIYFDKTYYLGAQEVKNKAYALLRTALEKTNKIGVARVTIRSKQSLAVVRVYQDCLVMETIFYPDEVRAVDHVPEVPSDIDLPDRELQMAEQLIEQLTVPFEPEKYQDDHRQELQQRVEAKIAQEEIVESPEAKPDKVIDLMAALQASLEAVPKKTTKTNRKKKVTAKG